MRREIDVPASVGLFRKRGVGCPRDGVLWRRPSHSRRWPSWSCRRWSMVVVGLRRLSCTRSPTTTMARAGMPRTTWPTTPNPARRTRCPFSLRPPGAPPGRPRRSRSATSPCMPLAGSGSRSSHRGREEASPVPALERRHRAPTPAADRPWHRHVQVSPPRAADHRRRLPDRDVAARGAGCRSRPSRRRRPARSPGCAWAAATGWRRARSSPRSTAARSPNRRASTPSPGCPPPPGGRCSSATRSSVPSASRPSGSTCARRRAT